MNYYSIEKHLAQICIENKEYEILNSIWNLNKKNLTNALSHVSFNFPHYSIHDGSHAKTIITNIESFLGEDRIKKLEPTDAFLILMSAYTHDIGMVVINKSIEESLHSNVLDEFLENSSNQNFDIDLSKAAKLLLNVKNKKLPIENTIFDIRKSIVLVVAEFYRKNHYIRSQEVLTGRDKEFKELLSNFYSDLIPNRILTVLGDIAYSHGVSFDFLINSLQKESNGIGKDKIHPRFISALLRLGDLLDVDDKRFNPISEKLISNSLPQVSERHRIKHASVKHLLIKDNSIEVIVDCPDRETYRIARQWFDWVEKEVEDQNKYWNDLVPSYFEGFPPVIKKNGIKVFVDNNQPDDELLNLRFSMRSEKAIEMFEGKGIYEDSSFVFIRELVQNAIDASKIQLWKDVINGIYDDIIKNHLVNKYSELANDKFIGKVYKYIKFPDDIPIEVYRQYQVDLKIDWANEIDGDIKIVVIDKGSGINRHDLLRMTKYVGDSRSKDKQYLEFKKSIPYWLKPTGAFGIGLQSVFLVVDSFNMITKADNNIGYEIIFNSSKNNAYSYIKSEIENIPRGTTVEVVIPKNKFGDAFGTSWSHDIIGKYDYFSTDESQYFDKIEEYIIDNFDAVEELNVHIGSRTILKSLYRLDSSSFLKPVFSKTNHTNNLRINAIVIKNKVRFYIDENTDIGSQILIQLLDDFNDISLEFNYISRKYNIVYKVRDIPIEKEDDIHYSVSPYLSIQWNLLNPESDKILNLARSKFIKEVRRVHTKIFVDSIMPNIFDMIWEMLLDTNNRAVLQNSQISEEQINTMIFHLFLSAKIHDKIYPEPDMFKNLYFPDKLAINTTTNNKISVSNFLKINKYITIDKHNIYGNTFTDKYQELKPELIKICIQYNIDTLTLATYYFFYMSYPKCLIQIIDVPNKHIKNLELYVLSNKSVNNVEISKEMHSDILINIMDENKYSKERRRLVSFLPYSDILSVNNKRFNVISNNSTNIGQDKWIISPFNDKERILETIEILNSEENKDASHLKSIIREKIINKLIPNKLINWIIAETSNPDKKIDKESILDAYSEMIVQSYLLKNKNNGAFS